MGNKSRGLRETVIRALAKVGLVWATAVLGALFMAMAAQGHHHDGGYSLSSASARAHHTIAAHAGDAPRPAGLALALAILGGGTTVLAIGACRGDHAIERSVA